LPSLLEPSDVELGIELHAVVERLWWDNAATPDSTRYGGGVAFRLRGGGDYDLSPLIAESRLFVRFMSTRWDPGGSIARTTGPAEDRETRELMVLVGIGASFGAGEPGYLQRFRMRPFDAAARALASGWSVE
jgi:hypothetical protein